MTARQEIENEVRNWSKAEVLDLASRLIAIAQGKPEPSKTGDLTRYYGILKTDFDPMEYQRQIRAEWD
ncbi:hypothetical protein [Fimbriimonas ginsengisoli]|uniref:Uncharacterized protein n=1 Tax=Fimbriimonas ginsengisoli Gsoil 348 TaxID=661478 RepID=A0A068NMV7_FIMGI|nr:hypothetical protein [Fimbriimonas ginsengisoli]AIE84737.1 hypothetical protein OP10G_1369 [Fimbriimonas ginsengisoli Gsoil 348]